MNSLVVVKLGSWFKIMTKIEAHKFIFGHKGLKIVSEEESTWILGY